MNKLKVLILLSVFCASTAFACYEPSESLGCKSGEVLVQAELFGETSLYCFNSKTAWFVNDENKKNYFDSNNIAKAEFYQLKDEKCVENSFCTGVKASAQMAAQEMCK